jgi:hypothetical protein
MGQYKNFPNCWKKFKHPGKHFSGILQSAHVFGQHEKKLLNFLKLPKIFG